MTDEQQKDVEAANHLRGMAHARALDLRTLQAYDRAISALETRANAPTMRQISRKALQAYCRKRHDPDLGERHQDCYHREYTLICGFLLEHDLLAEPTREPHPLDALKFPRKDIWTMPEVADKINSLIDYLKQQEAKQP